MLRVQDVAKLLDVSEATVYRHKDALGAVRVGNAIRFFDNVIEKLQEGRYALSDAQREMAGQAHDKREGQDKGVPGKARGHSLGSPAKSRSVERAELHDPHGLLA